jgi:hypothetical protein
MCAARLHHAHPARANTGTLCARALAVIHGHSACIMHFIAQRTFNRTNALHFLSSADYLVGESECMQH